MRHTVSLSGLTTYVDGAYSQTMSLARTANLLGAIALGLADDILETAERHVAHGGCTPAALYVIGHEPGLSIDFLARVLGMSHPGTVRLVDRLEADGLIQRTQTKTAVLLPFI